MIRLSRGYKCLQSSVDKRHLHSPEGQNLLRPEDVSSPNALRRRGLEVRCSRSALTTQRKTVAVRRTPPTFRIPSPRRTPRSTWIPAPDT